MDIFKKKRRRIIITGLAGIMAASALFTGCNARETGFAGPDGRVNNNRETTVSDGRMTDALRDFDNNFGTATTTNHTTTNHTTTNHTTTNHTTTNTANTTNAANTANTTNTTNDNLAGTTTR